MRHERVAARLGEYLEGSLSARAASRIEAHLVDCEPCRRVLAELGQTVELLRGLRGDPEAPDLTKAVMSRIRAGEAEPSWLGRLRSAASSFVSGPLGAPAALAALGLVLVALLPPIQIEVLLPDLTGATSAPVPRQAALPSTPARMPAPPLAALRRAELTARDPFACVEAPASSACRAQHATMMQLAMENARAFMEQVQAVPEARRDPWLQELSRFAAESGASSDVAARLRATGDPFAQRVAARFEEAR